MAKKKIDSSHIGINVLSAPDPATIRKTDFHLDPDDPEDAHETLRLQNFKSTLIKYIKDCNEGFDFVPTKNILSDIAQRRRFAAAILTAFVTKGAALLQVKKNGGKKDYPTTLTDIAEITDRNFEAVISTIHINEYLEIYGATLKIITSTKYVAPTDPFELRWHLETIFLFYLLCEFLPQISNNLLLKMDYALTTLSRNSALYESKWDKMGSHADRVMLSRKSIKSKKADRRQAVIEEYYRISNRDKLSKHRIATMIQDRLKERGIKPPVPETIKRYLRNEGLM